MKAEQLDYGIVQYKTPLYIFDLDILKGETNRIRKGIGNHIGLCYAMKANPFVTEYMASLTDHIEICSMGEFQICREVNIPPEKMLISGVLKKHEDVKEILNHCQGRCSYTIESLGQYAILLNLCREQNIKIRVYLRLSSGSQFGMDENDVRDLVKEIDAGAAMELEGIHYFSGTQKRSMKAIRKELDYLDDFLIKLEAERGTGIKKLEYGPGLSVNYFIDQKNGLYQDEGLYQLADILSGMKWSGHITLEMGRAFTARCGYYLTQIRDLKNIGDRNYCIVDGGIHQMNYDGQIRGMHTPHILISPERSGGIRKDWIVCGSLCTTNDILCSQLPIDDAEIGDVLVFTRTGAYSVTEGMAMFLSHELPAVVLYSEAMGWKLVRQIKELYKWNSPREEK